MSSNSTSEGLFTSGPADLGAKVAGIPLSDVDAPSPAASIGELVSSATAQMSSLVRAEVELAKTEIVGEVKKGALGGGLFGAAGVIALYSTFFLFIAIAEGLDVFLDRRWLSYLLVFLLMLVLAGLLVLVGLKKFKQIGAPQQTIDSAKQLTKLVPGKAANQVGANQRGMFTSQS